MQIFIASWNFNLLRSRRMNWKKDEKIAFRLYENLLVIKMSWASSIITFKFRSKAVFYQNFMMFFKRQRFHEVFVCRTLSLRNKEFEAA